MTQNKDRKTAICELADATGLPYSEAARKLSNPRTADANDAA